MTERIEKTLQFWRDTAEKSEYWKKKPDTKRYRYEHSIRVAKIGAEIARQEGMDVEAMTVACLLHDVSYGLDFNEERTIPNHGYTSAVYSRPFLESLGYSGQLLDDMCYGIAFHCSEPEKLALIPGQRNTFTDTIRNADDIDHFSIYRFYEDFNATEFLTKNPEEQQQLIWNTKGFYDWYDKQSVVPATKTAEKLYKQNLAATKQLLENFQKLIDDSNPAKGM